jgi:uncharacterized membrane protein YagU involved in acid resistance
MVGGIGKWLDEVDPRMDRRLKGLRLVAAYAVAAALGGLWDALMPLASVKTAGLAAGFALWGSVSEERNERVVASRDLVILCGAAMVGAITYCLLAQWLARIGLGSEATLVTAAFLVAYLKRFGALGSGIGSQIYIGQLLAFGADAQAADIGTICSAGLLAMLAATLPRWLIHRAPRMHAISLGAIDGVPPPPSHSTALLHAMVTATAALAVVMLNHLFGLTESAWAITACVYVITATVAGTVQRARDRVYGTLVGVPVGLLCMPVATHALALTWTMAALAMIVYTVALPRRYDIACGAFAFALMVTLELSGQRSVTILIARIWETMLGATLALSIALLVGFVFRRAHDQHRAAAI